MPIWIGDGLVLASPADAEYIRADPRAVVLDAGQTFGTGTHPTTQMCLLELQRQLAPRDRVLDVGTGSGVLAFAAVRLGAGRVVAIDKSLVACQVARANVCRNGLEHAIAVVAGTPAVLGQVAGFDVVVANLDSGGDAVPWLQTLSRLCRVRGRIILSGCRTHEERTLLVGVEDANLTRRARETQANWITLVLEKSA
jgi:ribosomal protein L11 methyltransferase